MVESDQLTKGWQKECCMLAMANYTPWTTLGLLLGRHITVVKKLLGYICMNASLQAHTYIP